MQINTQSDWLLIIWIEDAFTRFLWCPTIQMAPAIWHRKVTNEVNNAYATNSI